MQGAIIFLLALAAVVAAEGQFYVPRAYYTIDSDGHPSPPVALRRLRRSFSPYPYIAPYGNGADASANANANSWGGSASANANANAYGQGGAGGGWSLPNGRAYGSSPLRH